MDQSINVKTDFTQLLQFDPGTCRDHHHWGAPEHGPESQAAPVELLQCKTEQTGLYWAASGENMCQKAAFTFLKLVDVKYFIHKPATNDETTYSTYSDYDVGNQLLIVHLLIKLYR